MFLRLTEKSHRHVPAEVRHRFVNQNFTGSHTENCLAFFSLVKSYGPVKGAVNHWVTGSSPVGGANYQSLSVKTLGLFYWGQPLVNFINKLDS